jgi:hypothetical protein
MFDIRSGALCALVAVVCAPPATATETGLPTIEPPLPAFTHTAPEVAPRARLDAEPSVDERAGPWACNLDTLLDELDCVLAGRVAALPAPRASAENTRALQSLSDRLCLRLARESRDPRLVAKVRARCVASIADLTAVCARQDTELVDVDGHFGEPHALCYASLLAAVRELRTISQTYAPCCACLVDAGCVATFAACAADVVACRPPRVEDDRCDAARCENTCRATELLAPRSGE